MLCATGQHREMLDNALPASACRRTTKGRFVSGTLLNFNLAAKHAFAQLPRVLNAAAASASVDCICDWASSLEEIDVVLNGGQDLALEAV